jgi:eukaryotic-like serine/threonine-protein kinase
MTAEQPGAILWGKYQLEEVLGQGGMGTVWRARNLALDSPVAIKLLSVAGDSQALRKRLLTEARAAAKLAHPAIVKVFDVAETERGEPFIVMELLSGASFGALLSREGRLPAVRVVQILLPIAEALSVAHGKGLVHRDVKPDNVFIVEDEGAAQPKLVDFGIVKLEQQHGDGNLTRAGDVLGSPDYMSPEQARGDAEITFATDVWALSVVIYEAIAGHPPFSGNNYNALMWQILEGTPRTLQELGAADGQLSAIVARGLNKDPTQRFPSMRELGRALAQWLLEQNVGEDICGTSLESKWLARNSLVGTGPRSSLWGSEASSGLRARFAAEVPGSHAQTVPSKAALLADKRAATTKRVATAAAFVLLVAGTYWLTSQPKASPPAAASLPGAAAHALGTGPEARPTTSSSPSGVITPESKELLNPY